MSTELDTAAKAVVSRAGPGEELEAYGLHRAVTRVQAGTGGDILNVGLAETRGIGIRVVAADRTGYASTADLSDAGLAHCLLRARESTRLGSVDPAERLPPPSDVPDMPQLEDPALTGTPIEDKVALAVDLARRTTTLDPRVRRIDTATYRDERTTVVIASTTGVNVRHDRGFTELSVDAVGDDRDSTALDWGYCTARSPGDCDVEALARSAVERTVRLLGTRRPAPAGVPIVFDTDVAAILLEATGRGLTFGTIGSGRGPFAGRGGTPVAGAVVTLVDDGLHPRSPATAPFDDEGTPRQRTPLMNRGTVVGVLHSAATAAAAGSGQASTGNARRGSHKSPPAVAPTTLLLEHTTATPDLLAHAPELVYVQQLSAGRSGVSAVTGRIDVGAVGFLVRSGEAAGALEPIPLSTTLPRVLQSVLAVGDDARAVPESPVFAPTLLCDGALLAAGQRGR